MTAKSSQVHHRLDYRPPAFTIRSVVLDFDLREGESLVRSRLLVERHPAADPRERMLRLDGEELELCALHLDGRALSPQEYRLDPEGLEIPGVPDRFELESLVRIHPARNTRLEGLYLAGGVHCTQCEAEGFRRITYFLDRPDVMARYRVRIEADREACPVLLSNGNRIGAGPAAGGRHWVEFEDPFPKPCYLFALVAGELDCHRDRFTTRSGREVELEIWVEPRNCGRTAHAMRSLQRAMRWDEEVYGLECDLDQYRIVAVDEFNMGAMENKGLNVFNSKFVLASPETATDADYEGIEAVIAHEYFHNWTGNRVTCRDWFQLSLKEGLTVFRDQEFSADMGSRAVKRISDVRILRTHQFAEDAGPMAHPVRPESYVEMNNFYTVTVYNKGAEVVRMLHSLLGPKAFRRGMDLYFARHDGQAVTCDDFRAAMADASGRDLAQFERWYLQAGTPTLAVEGVHDPRARSFTLTLTQSTPPTPGQPEKLPFHLPFALGLLDAQGRDLPLQLEGEPAPPLPGTRVLELCEERQGFTFVGLPGPPVASLNRGFSAPVKQAYDRPRHELAFLMAHDSDAFNRWEAGQEYALLLLLERIAAGAEGRPFALERDFVEALRAILRQPEGDDSLRALALCLPSEAWLAEQLEELDPGALHAAWSATRVELARALRPELLATWRARDRRAPYDLEARSIGARRLEAVCLGYLMLEPETELVGDCLARFRGADNMTEVLSALDCLASHAGPERELALGEFHARWRHDPLVLDKWFAIQAMADRPDQLERVRALRRHPDFHLEKPNRVRALAASFATGNFCHFHAASGEGYAFLAEIVLETDALNPQLASRLVDPLLRWSRLEPGRRAQMRAELERIEGEAALSKDVREKVAKSLEPVRVG